MNFKEWLERDLLIEVFGQEEIKSSKPLDAVWHPPLDQEATYREMLFNCPSDPKKDCGGHPCYKLVISNDNDVLECSISFKHTVTWYRDRFDQGATAEEKVLQQKIGKETMMGILYGLGEYIKKWKPVKLRWGAILKSDSMNNPEARKKVYKLWAKKNLFPKHYIPVDDQIWIRRDVYDKYVVPKGFPELPKDEIGNSDRGKLVDQIIRYAADHYTAIQDAEDGVRGELAAERDHRRRERERIDIERLNTRKFKIDDEVIINYGDRSGDVGKITRVYMYEGELTFDVWIDDNWSSSYSNDQIEKATPEAKAAANERREEIIRSQNPDGLKAGDAVLCMSSESPATIVSFWIGDADYMAVLQSEDGYTFNDPVVNLKKDTPENREKAKMAKEIVKIETSLKGLERVVYAINNWNNPDMAPFRSAGEMRTLLARMQATDANPNRVQIGDRVSFKRWNKDVTGAAINAAVYPGSTNPEEYVFFTVFDYEKSHGTFERRASELTKLGPIKPYIQELKQKHEQMKEALRGWLRPNRDDGDFNFHIDDEDNVHLAPSDVPPPPREMHTPY